MEDETKGAPEEQADGAEVDDLAGALGDAWDEVAGDDAEAEAEKPDDKPKEEVAEETVEEPVEETAEAEGEKEEVKALDDEEETTDAGEEVETAAAPEHWSAADKERFESLGDDHKSWFLDIRKSLETGYQSKFEEVAEYRKERQALDGLFQPHDEELALQGTDRVGAIRQLLAAHRSLQSRPGETIAWLAQPDTAMFAVAVANAWRFMPYMAIMLLAGLHGISRDLYEAAQVDGANPIQSFRHITLLELRHVITVVFLFSLIWMANDFALIYVMTEGGPANATQVLPIAIYRIAFEQLRLGRGAAASMILLVFLLCSSLLFIRVFFAEDTQSAD